MLSAGRLSNSQQRYLFEFLVLSSLAISSACDPSTLPRGVRISTNGPVLKLTCEPQLQPFEMAHFPNATSNTTADDAADPFPVPSKRKFARYVCMYGTSYQRVNPHGIELSHFFCADVDKSRCDGLEYSREQGGLLVDGTVAVWRSKSSTERSILYCIHGVWHRLGDGLLPPGVTDKHQIKGRARLTVMTSTPAIALKDAEVASTSTLSNPPSTRTSESPVKESSLLNPIYLSRLRLPPFSRSRTHVSQTNSKSPTPPERAFSSRSQSLNAYVPQGSLIAISQSVSLAIYDSLHRLTRVVFYCMLAIGIAMLTIGLMIYLFLRQRRARLAADEAEAQRRLKYTISVV